MICVFLFCDGSSRRLNRKRFYEKWQSKRLFLLIFDLRFSIVLEFSIAAYPV